MSAFTQEQVQQLFLSVHWISGNYPERLYKALMHSSTVLTVWDEKKLVGLTRVLDDTARLAQIHYVLVHPEYQGQGIAGKMIEYINPVFCGLYMCFPTFLWILKIKLECQCMMGMHWHFYEMLLFHIRCSIFPGLLMVQRHFCLLPGWKKFGYLTGRFWQMYFKSGKKLPPEFPLQMLGDECT